MTAPSNPNPGNPLTGLLGELLPGFIQGAQGVDRVAAVLAAFFATLTDGKFWRSLGWLLLGLVLLGIGIVVLIGPAADKLEGR